MLEQEIDSFGHSRIPVYRKWLALHYGGIQGMWSISNLLIVNLCVRVDPRHEQSKLRHKHNVRGFILVKKLIVRVSIVVH